MTRVPVLGERLRHKMSGKAGPVEEVNTSMMSGDTWVTIRDTASACSWLDVLEAYEPDANGACFVGDLDAYAATKPPPPPPVSRDDFPGHPRFRIVEQNAYTMLVEHKTLGEKVWLQSSDARRDVAEAFWAGVDKYVPWARKAG